MRSCCSTLTYCEVNVVFVLSMSQSSAEPQRITLFPVLRYIFRYDNRTVDHHTQCQDQSGQGDDIERHFTQVEKQETDDNRHHHTQPNNEWRFDIILLVCALTGLMWSFQWYRDIVSFIFDAEVKRGAPIWKIVRALHFGTYAGMFSKIVTFIAALIGTSLPVTGYWMYLKRKKLL